MVRDPTQVQPKWVFSIMSSSEAVVELNFPVNGTSCEKNILHDPLPLTFAMVKVAPIKKELDLRYGDIGNIQGRVYFLQNTKTP
jgi:hypothetical protein